MKRHDDGRDSKWLNGKRFRKIIPGAHPTFLVKIIADRYGVLGRRRKARVLSECVDNYTPGIFYSINKKNRWAQTEASVLLNCVKDDDNLSAQVVELKASAPVDYCKTLKVVALHELNHGGQVISKFAKGQGTAFSSISTPARQKQRGCRRRREIATQRIADEEKRNGIAEKKTMEKVKVRYTILNDQPMYHNFSMKKRSSPKPRRVRVKRVDVSESEYSEIDESIHADENEYKPTRDLRFCLGDYIMERVQPAISKPQKSFESIEYISDIEVVDLPKQKPVEFLDMKPVFRLPVIFEYVNIDIENLNKTKFIEQVEAVKRHHTVRWLDLYQQRISIDVTTMVFANSNYTNSPAAIIIMERCRNNKKQFLKVFLNTTIPAVGEFNWKIFKKRLVEFGARRLTDEFMANSLREKCETLESDPFEKVNMDDFEYEFGEEVNDDHTASNLLSTSPIKVGCHACSIKCSNNLFEMDDCWMCRDCLKQLAIHQIRTNSIPINLPFVIPDSTSSYDVLPSILPLTLLNFYTKLAAVQIIEQSPEDVTELTECPGCRQTVEISKQNEYNSILCECGIVWCSECKKEPHWPMSCQMSTEWTRRFKQQCIGDDGCSHNIREITCQCSGPPILIDETENFAECKNCSIGFNPQTMLIVSKDGHLLNKTEKYLTKPNRVLKKSSVNRIRKDVLKICQKARNYRFDTTKLNELEKACRNLNGSVPILENLRDIRQTVLYIIEYGMAWIHTSKAVANHSAIKSSLVQLLRFYEELISTINYKR
ncbi:hypothetical protein DICVIV_05429 [Dictyocaulus viviparus]|uniref:IBR domain-containing protein n=1 Tax=Dictyocaulus viviparus TaxID=29172 RepID=A0A0D8XXG5_DICVI|nr:hypothetical protein DICVIV_05429 [Dictyocaulus viviparus]